MKRGEDDSVHDQLQAAHAELELNTKRKKVYFVNFSFSYEGRGRLQTPFSCEPMSIIAGLNP